jgi:hypothetical protein
MALIALPQRFIGQPQYAPELAEAYQDAELLSLFNDGSGQDIAKGNHLVPGVAPSPVVRQQGKALSFDGANSRLSSTRPIPNAAQFTVLAWVRPAALNSGYSRILETHFGSQFYLGSNTGSQYAWIVNNSALEGCAGGQQVVGQRDFLAGVFDGASAKLYINGVQVGSIATTTPSTSNYMVAGYSNAGGAFAWKGDIDTVGVFNRAFPASEIWSLYQDPWRLFKAPPKRLWIAGSSDLIGDSSIQANAGSMAAITQAHALTGTVSAQANACDTAAIGQAHILSVSISAQVNASTTMAVTQVHILAGAASTQGNLGVSGAIGNASEFVSAPSTQANFSGTDRITQVQPLTGVASSQNNIAGGVAVTLSTNLDLIGAASAQANSSGAAVIGQAHILLVPISSQVNASTAMAVTQVHIIAGAASTQGNLGGSGAISIASELVSAPSIQANFCGTGRITRLQALAGANSSQANLSVNGDISGGIVVEPSLTTGIAATLRIKKPGIPAGTPEWLKTMIEILTGRRGNRIEVPKFKTLTFSATPTQTECEALYAYLNTVRDALEQLISRMDG